MTLAHVNGNLYLESIARQQVRDADGIELLKMSHY